MTRRNRSIISALVLMLLLALTFSVASAHGGQKDEGAPKSGNAEPQPGDAMTMAGKPVAVPPMTPGPMDTVLRVTVAKTDDQTVTATATLTDTGGKPIPGMMVTLVRRTAFGQLDLGSLKTDKNGTVKAEVPAAPGQEISVTTRFTGNKMWKSAEAAGQVSIPPKPADIRPGGLTTPYPNPWFVALLGIVVGGIWSTYAWVFYTLGRIRRASLVVPAAHPVGIHPPREAAAE
ncbi:MAG: hypothetical protein M1598_10370 [Actinobacteria bacterium]|nr:hypothetical protein [Actinomycetota bacterium]